MAIYKPVDMASCSAIQIALIFRITGRLRPLDERSGLPVKCTLSYHFFDWQKGVHLII